MFLFQEGEHSSVQDAQATMRLYTMFRKEWENELLKKRQKNKNVSEDVLKSLPQDTIVKKKIASKNKPTDSNNRLQYQDSDSE